MPKAKMDRGRYVCILDRFQGYGFDSEKLMDFLVNEAGARLTMGGTSTEGRICQDKHWYNRKMLKEALEKIAKALKQILIDHRLIIKSTGRNILMAKEPLVRYCRFWVDGRTYSGKIK